MKREYNKLWNKMQKIDEVAHESRIILEELMENDSRKVLEDMEDDICDIMEKAAILQYMMEDL